MATTAWADEKQLIMTRWPALSEQELDSTKGDHYALQALLEVRLGYAPANAKRDLDKVLAGEIEAPHDVADTEHHTGTAGPVPSQ